MFLLHFSSLLEGKTRDMAFSSEHSHFVFKGLKIKDKYSDVLKKSLFTTGFNFNFQDKGPLKGIANLLCRMHLSAFKR